MKQWWYLPRLYAISEAVDLLAKWIEEAQPSSLKDRAYGISFMMGKPGYEVLGFDNHNNRLKSTIGQALEDAIMQDQMKVNDDGSISEDAIVLWAVQQGMPVPQEFLKLLPEQGAAGEDAWQAVKRHFLDADPDAKLKKKDTVEYLRAQNLANSERKAIKMWDSFPSEYKHHGRPQGRTENIFER